MAEQNSHRFRKVLPIDRTNFVQAWKLFESYSKIPSSEIDAHVTAIRNKAFEVFHYPCLGRWRFLDLYITQAPEYQDIITRLKAGDKLLDVGCCFGHILRQLAFDGAPSQNLAGTDLRPEFVELGYELFRDKDTFQAQFVTEDIFGAEDKNLDVLIGNFDIVHAASFFHLFGWEDQVRVGEKIVKFFKPGTKALLVGRQVGSREPESLEVYAKKGGESRYHHDVGSLQILWDEIGKRTGTKWRATGDLIDVQEDMEDDNSVSRTVIRFAVFKLN